MSWRYPAEPPVACGAQARRPAAEMWHFFSWSKVHGTVQGPVRSVISLFTRHPHTAIEVFTLSLSSSSSSPNLLSPTFFFQTLCLQILFVQTLIFAMPLQFVGSYSIPDRKHFSLTEQ